MKSIILLVALVVSFNLSAKDMSRTETYEEAYRETEDGSNSYIGKCTVHQDYEGSKFNVTKVIVPYFEPREFTEAQKKQKVKKLEPELLAAAQLVDELATDFLDVDDLTVEKINSTVIVGLDLYRLNMGVGGGNGIFAIFNRRVVNGKPSYEQLASIMDGDVEFCDSKVWLK